MATNPSSGRDDRLSSPSMESVRDATNAIDGGHPLEPKSTPAPEKQADPVFQAYADAKSKSNPPKSNEAHDIINAKAPKFDFKPNTKEAKNLDKAMANQELIDFKDKKSIASVKETADKIKSNMVSSKDVQKGTPDKLKEEFDKVR